MSGLLILATTRYNLWSCFNEAYLSLKEKNIHSFGNFLSLKYRNSLSYIWYFRNFFSIFLTKFKITALDCNAVCRYNLWTISCFIVLMITTVDKMLFLSYNSCL